jgi:hypothetical protein
VARGFDRLSGALQYQIVNTLGFTSLRPVQEMTIDAVLDGDDCVVLAPTAGGKTEAAFFPLISRMSEEDWRPTSVLYLSPIRALLNNQEDRLQRLTGLVGRRAFKWHGDVGPRERLRFLEEPADVLLTTPESLEAMLMSPRDAGDGGVCWASGRGHRRGARVRGRRSGRASSGAAGAPVAVRGAGAPARSGSRRRSGTPRRSWRGSWAGSARRGRLVEPSR